MARLQACGPTGAQTAAFLHQRRVKIAFHRQAPAVGAMWTLSGAIHLNARYFSPQRLDEPRLLALLVHETCHLRQGLLTALSIYGELEAWQADFGFQYDLTGAYPAQPLQELCALPLVLDRQVLRHAQTLMLAYAGSGYRADLLPLYPFPLELRWRLGWG